MGFSRTQGALVASVLTVASVASVAFQSENMVDAATKVTLSKTEYTLKVGESFKLKLKGAKAVKFASTNKKVAKVSSSGKVKAKKAGTATIKVYDENGKVYKCKVTVTKKDTNKDTNKDNGNIDLGGMEIIIRDWWSGDGDADPKNEYEVAQRKYQEEMMEKYNFKIKQISISDWGTAPEDFIYYTTSGGDSSNYVFVLRSSDEVNAAMTNGLMYDLSTLDCLDFSEKKFAANRTHELYSYGSHIYCCSAGPSEPRDGLFMNMGLLRAAGVDPDKIYDMQKNGTWTWDEFEKILAKVQRDTDSDGMDDVFGLCCNNYQGVNAAVVSNGGTYIGKNSKGKFTYNLEDKNTLQALNWITDVFTEFNDHDPEDAMWDYYLHEFKDGKVAFMLESEYQGTGIGQLRDVDFEVGFVMFPKGPKADKTVNIWNDNLCAIPACYSADRAWKIAFAWNLFTNPVPGYEDYNEYVENAKVAGIVDKRAIEETIPMMCEADHGVVLYGSVVQGVNLGADFVWGVGPHSDIAFLVENVRDKWKADIEEMNKIIK